MKNEINVSSRGNRELVLEYVYVVSGKAYRSNRRSFPMMSPTQQLLNKYPIDSTIPIYYDPDHPEQAVIYRGFENGGIFTAIASSFIALSSIILGFIDIPIKKY